MQNVATQVYVAGFILSIIIFRFSLFMTSRKVVVTSLIQIGKILGYFFLAGITDTQIYNEQSRKTFLWPLKFLGDNLIVFGDILPGIYLIYYIYTRFVAKSSIRIIYPAIFTSYVSCAFGLLCYQSLKVYLKFRPDPKTHFMNHLHLVKIFCEWNILLRTIYQMIMQRKAFSLAKQPLSFRAKYLMISLLPLTILLGNVGTSMQVLCIFLIHDEIFGGRKAKLYPSDSQT